jgi:hypothetical protein
VKTRNVPIVISGGLDTKTNPKLLKPGAALQMDNMFEQRTGEWRVRNGASPLAAGTIANGGITADMFPSLTGGLMANLKTWNAQGFPNVLCKYVAPGPPVNGWVAAVGGVNAPVSNVYGPSYPRMTASVTGWMTGSIPTSGNDLYDPDIGITSTGLEIVGATNARGGGPVTPVPFFETRDSVTGAIMEIEQAGTAAGQFNAVAQVRPPVMVTGSVVNGAASPYVAWVRLDTTTTPYSLWVDTLSAGGFSIVSTKIVNADVSTAQPWFDAMHINAPSGTYVPFVVAYRASAAGGVSFITFNPQTSTVNAGPVNTAGLAASMGLNFLTDDSAAEGSAYLATADAGAGIKISRIVASAGSVALQFSNTIDATATANVRQVTGYIAGATHVIVMWDVDASPTYNQQIKVAEWTGSPSPGTAVMCATMGLYSRAFTAPDGQRYVVASYDSTAFPAYAVIRAGVPTYAQQPMLAGLIYPGYAGGRRTVAGSLASAASVNGAIHVPITKKQSFTTGTGFLTTQRSVGVASLVWNAPLRRPRELGGTLFMPGGMIVQEDGAIASWAAVPIPPESPTFTQSAGGSLTAAGVYFYRVVIKQTSVTGRVTRSAGSVPVSVTLTAGNQTVTVTCPAVGLEYFGQPAMTYELYRSGPAGAGATAYNRVAEQAVQIISTTVVFVDTMSDVNAAAGELLYSTGNVLENTAPPSCNLMEVNAGRLWIANAEDPTELWFSKEYVAGSGIGFNSNSTLRIQGDGAGGVTALAAMDGRLIVFKRSAIYVVSGAGPNNLGSGSFNPPQAVSLVLGTVNPSSVVQTPDGVLFQATNGGIWLLDRGLSLSYVGGPVESTALAASIVDCSLVSGQPQARFIFSGGTCLVWDYFQKKWYAWKLYTGGSAVTACADTSLYGWCYATANGSVYQEVAGQTFDNVSTAIIPVISLPHLNFAGLSGYQRVYSLDLLFDVVGNHTFSVDAEYNYSGALTGNPKTKAMTTATPTAQVQYLPPDGSAKCTAMRPVITVTGNPTGGTFRLTSVTAVVGIKSGTNISDSNRLT